MPTLQALISTVPKLTVEAMPVGKSTAVGVSLPTAVTETIAGLLMGETLQLAVIVSVPIDAVQTILATPVA